MPTRDPYLRRTFRYLMYLGLTIAALKVSHGLFGGVIVLFGIASAFQRRSAWAMIAFSIMPLMTVLNPAVVSGMGKVGLFSKLGIPLIATSMMLAGGGGRDRLPLGTLALFVVCAAVSSMQGYMPLVSYLKIVNFAFFMIGLYCGTRNIARRPQECEELRAFFFAFALFIVIGSLLVRSNPTVGYYTTLGNLDAADAEAVFQEMVAAGMSPGYFCGITNHSQCLGPMLVCIFGWVACDMLFVVKNVRKLHVFVLALCPVFIYMTRSRTALLALITVSVGLWIFVIPRVRVSGRLKARIVSLAFGGAVLLLSAALVLEVVNHGMSRMMRKTDDVSEDSRGLAEALTSSRQGLIQRSMRDFQRNPLLGMGFQTDEMHSYLYEAGKINIFSAPIEKGFWPSMVLGETGIVGMVAFLIFLWAFFSGCFRRRYLITGLLFLMYLFVNFGEANIFSPGGNGGPSWLQAVVGGFVLDMVILRHYEEERRGYYGY